MLHLSEELIAQLKKNVDAPSAGASNAVNSSVTYKNMGVPKLQTFSGDDTKSDITYKEWLYEVNGLKHDTDVPESCLSQATRRSLKGSSRKFAIDVRRRSYQL